MWMFLINVCFLRNRHKKGRTVSSEHPYLSGALEPMLCCKFVRSILRVLVQPNQKMVRPDSSCSLRRDHQRVEQREKSHGRPVSRRSTHRVWLVSIRLSAWARCAGCSLLMMGGRRGGGGTGGRGGGCKEVQSKPLRTHLLVGRWWDRWKLYFTEAQLLPVCGSTGKVARCGPNLHPQLSMSPPPPPLICNSFTFLARVLSARDVVPMGSGGCVPSLPPSDPGALFSTLENSSHHPQSW